MIVEESIITKLCSKCKLEKTLDCFYNEKRYSYGKASICKDCKKSQCRNRARKKLSTEEGKILNQKRSTLYREAEPEKFKWSVKQATYKKLGLSISKEEYDEMYSNQEGNCAICGNPPSGFKKALCLDHCHDTLKIRELLCDSCNFGLGKFKDDVNILLKAVDYLRKHGK